MPDELEYIVDKAIVRCDKGAKFNYFRSTYNTHVKIMGCMAATRVDKIPLVNIPEFGVCAVTGGQCTPAPIEWMETYKLKVKGEETLLYRCTIPCSVGGIVDFVTSGQIPISPEELAAMTDANSEQGPPTEEVVEEEVEEEVEQEVDAEGGEDEGLSWWDGVEMIPFVGGVVGTVRSGSKGDWLGVGLSLGSVALDVGGLFSFGGGNVASAAVKGGKLARVAVKAGRTVNKGKKIVKVLRKVKKAKVITKPGIKALTKAGAKNLAVGLAKKVDDIALKTGKICVFACFPAGTLVDTESGKVPIERIKIGTRVWAFDEATGATSLKEVTQTVERECDHTIEIHTEQETIETTAEHPFYTSEGWKDAADLQVGDNIVTKDKQEIEIRETKFRYESRRVYNFEVAEWHTYFVGTLAWVVHNATPGKCATDIIKKTLTKGEGKVGTYKSLSKAGKKGDNITAHHIPSDGYMKGKNAKGYTRDEGISINMEQPRVGGRHRQTSSYGRSPDLSLSPRDALAKDIRDARRIYQKDGLYTPEIRKALKDVVKQNKQKWKPFFDKPPK